jgi:hypothetical protein
MAAASKKGRLGRGLRLVGLGALALVNGCALFEEPAPVPVAEPTAPVAAVVPPPTPPAPPPVPSRKPTPPVALTQPPAEHVDPERLINMSESEVADLLGDPEQRAEAPPATIWRYAGPTCEVDLYFYLDLQSKVTRVLHYEIHSNDGAERRRDRCFEQLVAGRAHASSGSSGADHPR